MSRLIDECRTTFKMMEKSRVSDGEGGSVVTWTEGLSFLAVVRHDTTIQARIAEQERTASTYTFLIDKNMTLDYHDVVKRVSDGQIFRITSVSGEDVTPSSSSLNLTLVTAEKWELTQ